MKLLSLECSATAASCAITEGNKLIASTYTDIKTTHSESLMPMAEFLLKISKTDISELDAFAIAAGPGSFTGIRIGISAVKGLAAAAKKPCYGVSTLEAMAYLLLDNDCIACPVMDARCSQVYNALFRISGGRIERLCEDRALMCEQLSAELQKHKNEKIILIGDGAEVFAPYAAGENILLASKAHQKQSAVGVALAAISGGKSVSAEELNPVYLRLPQAERELKLKQNKTEE